MNKTSKLGIGIMGIALAALVAVDQPNMNLEASELGGVSNTEVRY